ncbi:MAG: hypothetical protein MOB07_14005 [Acidobacteria bacterium]|nr:hypothetical protein [Acidobacteriota bacterium]
MRKAAEMGEDLDEQEKTLAEFFGEFTEQHAVKGERAGEVVLDVTAEECEVLGRSFIQVMVGWAAGLNLSRARRGILPVTISAETLDEDEEGPIH